MVLSACAGTDKLAPVDDQSRGVRDPTKDYRIIVAGDTLYSIAWEIGQDYRTLAKWNKIPPPYIIRPGQRLKIKLKISGIPGDISPAKKNTRYHKVIAGDTLYSLARNVGVSVKKLTEWNQITPPYIIKPGQKLRLTMPDSDSARTNIAKSSPSLGKPKKTTANLNHRARIKHWLWPAKGRVTRRFGQGGHKGLEISGKKGQAIRAAAAGKVVYQGSGLRGYGHLVIIKHNEEFLSAYAHCDRIAVNEGDVIKKGQRIASMSNTGTNKVKLHFEIRYRGSPVNPEQYLRRR